MDLRYRLSVTERDAGQQSQGQLGDVEVELGHEGRQLLQQGGEAAADCRLGGPPGHYPWPEQNKVTKN